MKRTGIRCISPIVLFVLLTIGCGDSHNPVAGGIEGDVAPAALQESFHSNAGNRIMWGLWKIGISADRETISVVPDRAGAAHFNVVRLLEVSPCSACLTFDNFQVLPDGTVSVDVTIIHPFPGLLQYTGFDVRGILISGTDYMFPESGRRIAWGDGIIRMLNPDGYTALFNLTDYPETDPPILGYIPGHKAPGGDLSATLNPYVAYEQDQPRCVFMPGTTSTRTVIVDIPPGPLEFGYAVDASWFPAGSEVIDPIADFPLEANAFEAYRVDLQLGQALGPMIGATAQVEVEVYDHQGLETISSVTVEAPDLFSGERALSFSTATGEESFLFTGIVENELGPDHGSYPLLGRIVDTETDQNLGSVNAWLVARIGVSEGWARTWGGVNDDWAWGVAVDDSGNVYVTGDFHSTVDFDPDGGDPHKSNGTYDVFLSKFDSSGNFDWARTWGGMHFEAATGVAADGFGNVYVTGQFGETVDFDPDGGDPHTANGQSVDVFLTKFDSSGDFQWARTWGGSKSDWGCGVAADGFGNIYVTGVFTNTVDFDPGGGDPHTSNGGEDVFLSKFDSSGNFEWARTWGGIQDDSGCGVAADGSSNVYVAGYFGGTVDFHPSGGDPHTSNGSEDAFLSRFDSSGNFKGARTWGGPEGDTVHGVAVDGSGNVYVTGGFRNTVNLDPADGNQRTSNGDSDVFLSKFDSSGNFQWARTWGGIHDDSGYGVAAHSPGNVYVVGQFMGTVDLDPGGGDPHTSNGDYGTFLSKFDSSGNFAWARTWGGARGWPRYGVAADPSGNAYTAGCFIKTVDFAPTDPPCNNDPDEHTANGDWPYYSDVFLTKHLPDGCW